MKIISRRQTFEKVICAPFRLRYMYVNTGGKHGEGAKLNFRNQLKASAKRSRDDIGVASPPLSFLLPPPSGEFSIPFVFPRSTIVLELSELWNSSFFFPIVPDRII